MLITIGQSVFSILKAKIQGNYPSDEYVQAKAEGSDEVVGLPISLSEVEEAEEIAEHIASIYAEGGDIDPWKGPKDPYILVYYDAFGNEEETDRCETLAEAVGCLASFHGKGYVELCVDNGNEAIYDVMRWPCADY